MKKLLVASIIAALTLTIVSQGAAQAGPVRATVAQVTTKPVPPAPKPPPELISTGQTCVFVSYGAIQANQLTEFSVNTGVVYNIFVESNPTSPPGSVTYMEVTGNAYGWVWGWVGHDTVSYIPLIYAGHFYAPAHNLGGYYTLIEVNHGLSYPFTCPSGMFPSAKKAA